MRFNNIFILSIICCGSNVSCTQYAAMRVIRSTSPDAKPSEISLPENRTLIVNNESIEDFDFSTAIDFQRRVSLWRGSLGEPNVDFKSTSWATHSQDNEHSALIQLPEEIQLLYPNMDTENMTYSETKLYLGFPNYHGFIHNKFITPILNSNFRSEEYLNFIK